MSRLFIAIVMVMTALTLGCMGSSTEVPVSGKLMINGQPIENVLVRFHPAATPDDEKAIASGVTDANGQFELARNDGKTKGASVGINIVTLAEGPIPEEVLNSKTPLAVESFLVGLKHRPLPVVYERQVDSTLKVEVKVGQGNYDLDIGKQR
jgi:hypothetical protein